MIRCVRVAALCLGVTLGAWGCTTMPEPVMKKYAFPKDRAFVGDVKRPYKKLGLVKTKVDFQSLDWIHEEDQLCRNFYNKAVADLIQRARKQGADAVIDVRSVVFLESGQTETYEKPECSDDGEEGQILLQGIAVKWLPADAPKLAEPTVSPSPTVEDVKKP